MATTPTREMIDIHMHLVPGVDDGAEDEQMALLMLLRAKDQGISTVFATPHSSAFDEDPVGTKEKFRQLCARAAQIFPEMQLYPGCEIYCETGRMQTILSGLESGKYPTMNRSRFVLMEFSQWVIPENTTPCVETLVNAGYTPIIAHMERYKYLRDNMELVDGFRELGATIQINAYSLFEEMEDSIKNWAGTEGGFSGHRCPQNLPPPAQRGNGPKVAVQKHRSRVCGHNQPGQCPGAADAEIRDAVLKVKMAIGRRIENEYISFAGIQWSKKLYYSQLV